MRKLILVNGPPASGKSTVVRELVAHLHEANVYEMDAVKEPFLDALEPVDTETTLLLSRASLVAIWQMIGSSSSSSISILDTWVQNPEREDAIAALQRIGADRVVEIWCDASVETIVERYARRVPLRHPGHPGVEFLPRLRELVAESSPIEVGELFRLDTEQGDTAEVARSVAELLRRSE